jgi:hypothetical protein
MCITINITDTKYGSVLTRSLGNNRRDGCSDQDYIHNVCFLECDSNEFNHFTVFCKLHNDGLHSLYSSPNIIRVIKSKRMRWVGHVACMGKGIDIYRVLVGRPEDKRPLRRPRCR